MPKKTSGGLETLPLVLTSSQVERLRAITALRQTDHNKVSLSSVAREVVERGLREFSFAHDSNPIASSDTEAVKSAA